MNESKCWIVKTTRDGDSWSLSESGEWLRGIPDETLHEMSSDVVSRAIQSGFEIVRRVDVEQTDAELDRLLS